MTPTDRGVAALLGVVWAFVLLVLFMWDHA